jgi:hypothetical protein
VLHHRFSHDAPRDTVGAEKVILGIRNDQGSSTGLEAKVLKLAEIELASVCLRFFDFFGGESNNVKEE